MGLSHWTSQWAVVTALDLEEAPGVTSHLEESFLNDILGGFPIPQKVRDEREHGVLVSAHEHAEACPVLSIDVGP